MSGGGRLLLSLASLVLQTGVRRRMGRRLALWLVVGILVAVAFGHLIASLQLALAAALPLPLATLLTALVLTAAAGALVLVLHLQQRRQAAAGTAQQIEALQRAAAELVRTHPWTLVGLAVALGVVTGQGQSPPAPPPRSS